MTSSSAIVKSFLTTNGTIIIGLCDEHLTPSINCSAEYHSSCPSNVDKIKGNTLILIIWLSTHVLLGYPRSIIAYYVQNYSLNEMLSYGVNVQLGALIGSIIIYHLIKNIFFIK
ncbi:unnamed protein product [Rotaria sp. Silwood2]|nr:unnamed protein product [Rotaria sp. Silwood2]